MQVPRVEDMVREEREPKRPHPQVPEDSLSQFLENEPDLIKWSKSSPAAAFRCAAEGTLADLGKRYSSVDLQHKALEWRGA